ncbi:ATP synthase F1 subunit gamma [Rickettsia typhi]|uniref:ATP synthase gamma chain n=2 Tax=Rickettsia typhi TaxID=785 RepID=ATPG_RICTY|nr:ATP synthase F1 subunit gamma [Rickettsia typhi]Q68VU7.1 RecName: Full=ATP synthase gamma chain; AltName: Full=ATP synthase F1 sector gamma subunit; AltName: Full=F-ATPase gamma subunit [Rickettsia typhi str. Wilmington]AAU04245.1 ATP synthase [Rickettsia typhi str. Wilmington]AFE54624.1 F0F1 ATP synthase subunit gamma [Rickettsia typhi str. TH1527]AFE55462.1 F0F1 ATP synthase subunit gamma [Rickettsia typhi str. B9991CWPP]
MSNLKQLRTRIKSVKSTQKITKAMQLVSASKMTKIKTQIANSNFYIEAINKMMSNIFSMTLCELSIEEQKFFNTMPSKANLLIVMTSERGLCGMFNYSIIKQVKNDIKELANKGEQIKLIIIGKKGYEVLKRQYANYIDSYFEFPKSHYANLILQLKEKIMYAVENLEISNCIIYFNKFKNAMTQILTKQKILPIEKHRDYSVVENYHFEYEGKNLISNLINLYLYAKINYALLQNIVSEEGARMTAMDSATNNANDLISKLVLKLNRSRQTIITTELIEIIAGAEAV